MHIYFSIDDADRGLPGGEYPARLKWRGRYEDVYDKLYYMLLDLVDDMPFQLVVEMENPVRLRFKVAYDTLAIGKSWEAIGDRMVRELQKAVLRGQIKPPPHFRRPK